MLKIIKTVVRRYILTGLLVLIPLFLTVWVVLNLLRWTDRALAFIPLAYRPEALIGFPIPGLGLIITFAILFVIGAFVANFMGRELLALGERILEKIPFLRWFYFSSKQLLESIFLTDGENYSRVILVEYPRKGLYSIGFVTGETEGELTEKVPGRSFTVFIPTTPNPTSGYLFIIPEVETMPLSWTVEEAFKMIISAGVLLPEETIDKETMIDQPGFPESIMAKTSKMDGTEVEEDV